MSVAAGPRRRDAMTMHYEVEQKFPLVDRAAIRQRLAELGAEFDRPIEQADTYFAHPARDFAKTDEALRLRQVGELNFITYKGPKLDAQTKTRREIELPLSSGAAAGVQMAEMLLALGFRRVLIVRKRREPGQMLREGQHVQIALDYVERLGDFLELELSACEATAQTAKAVLARLVGDLNLHSHERRSYLELLLARSQVQ
jgi:adenylate cyclase class 2